MFPFTFAARRESPLFCCTVGFLSKIQSCRKGASLTFSLSLTHIHVLRACLCPLSPCRSSVSFLTDERWTRWRATRGNGSNFVIYIGICKYSRYAVRCTDMHTRFRARARMRVCIACVYVRSRAQPSVFINDKVLPRE